MCRYGEGCEPFVAWKSSELTVVAEVFYWAPIPLGEEPAEAVEQEEQLNVHLSTGSKQALLSFFNLTAARVLAEALLEATERAKEAQRSRRPHPPFLVTRVAGNTNK